MFKHGAGRYFDVMSALLSCPVLGVAYGDKVAAGILLVCQWGFAAEHAQG